MPFSQDFHHRPIARQRPKHGWAADMEFGMRFFAKILATLMILLLMATTIIVILLHTRHSAALVNTLLKGAGYEGIVVAGVQYSLHSDPLHVRLIQPDWQRADAPALRAEQIDLWLSPATFYQRGWHFNSLLIQGVNLEQLPTIELESGQLSARRLAVTKLTLSVPGLQLANARLELDNWQNSPQSWGDFSGDFRLSAEQIIWHNQTLQQVLLDGEHKAQAWTLYGLSLNWQGARFHGQAEYQTEQQTLVIHQLTANGLKIDKDFPIQPLSELSAQARESGLSVDLRRLDILDSSLEHEEYSANHANLALENWHWPGTLWQQQDARLSLGADTLRWHDLLLDSPLTELHFSPEQISLNGFSARMLEGYLRAEATLTPEAMLLHQLELKGIRWVMPEAIQAWLMHDSAPQTPLQAHVDQWWRQLATLTVDQLSVGYSQLTGTYAPLPFQISDINLDGTGLVLLRQGQPGLWQGELNAGAGFTHIRQITLHDPLLTMSSQAGHWQITRLNLPIEEGLLEGSADIRLSEAGWPWALSLTGDSLPSQMLSHWLGLPLPLQGKMDISAQASGLGQFHRGLAYSLDGQLNAAFRQQSLTQSEASLLQGWQNETTLAVTPLSTGQPPAKLPVTLSPLKLQADRGRITMQPLTLQGQQLKAELKGEWDLATPSGRDIELKASDGCQQLTKRWHKHQQDTALLPCERNSI
ncbi:AsmA family protein [Photobacterium sp. TLY01]|uniref:AsmA family protein n=1 Tax=Photobacterium sp. TLY01 TaxID=2907534 RepID=UPI001F246E6B|nr:AsmA family protein [Photobacterium sp. TLY01]UIP27837.1 AsmA family protein [Photobacterium sp. TLY01]